MSTAVYVDTDVAKPYLHPVTTPSGRCLTRAQPPDHPWHHGLWFAIKFVDGDNFWEEIEPYGVVRTRTPGAFDAELDWVRPSGEVPITEHRVITVTDGDVTTIDLSLELTVGAADVVLDRTPYNGIWGGYGGLALRGAGDWSDTSILLAGASEPLERVVGARAAWCLLSSAEASALLLDPPTNPRHPTPWYGSTRNPIYGDDPWSNFINAAFLFEDGLPVAAGTTLSFRHRVVMADGRLSPSACASAWEAFTGLAPVAGGVC